MMMRVLEARGIMEEETAGHEEAEVLTGDTLSAVRTEAEGAVEGTEGVWEAAVSGGRRESISRDACLDDDR